MKEIEAMIIGFMIGDGWISVNGNAGFSGNIESLKILREDLIGLYKDIGKATIYTNETSSPKYEIEGVSNKMYINYSTRDKLIKMGAPVGNLVETEFSIPSLIKNGSIKLKRAFISGIYCAEGYTPSVQKNDKTPRPLGFTLTKRMKLKKNFYDCVQDLSEMLNDLKIDHSIKKKTTITCDKNIRVDFVFSNKTDNVLHQLKTINFRYCTYKEEESILLYKYLKKKKDVLRTLKKAYHETVIQNKSATEISKKYNLNRNQLYSWRERRTGVRIPNSFPTFSDFRQKYCSP